MSATTTSSPPPPPAKFDNAEQWHHSLGGVPLSRIVFDPWPGTATEHDLLAFVEGNRLCELVDGTLVEKPVGFEESIIAQTISFILQSYVIPRRLGVVTGPDSTMKMASVNRIRLPDVSFITAARFAALPSPLPRVPAIAPDLAVEVLSAGNTAAEMRQKLKDYFGSGTRLAWVVDPPSRTVEIYPSPEAPSRILDAADTIDGGGVLPGFSALVSDFFQQVVRASD